MEPLKNIFKTMFGRWEGDPDNQDYYVKIFFAFISGVVCALGGEAYAGVRGLWLGLLVYVLSLFVIVYLLEIDPEEIGGRQKLITKTLPSYLLLWVLLWSLLYGFVASPGLIENQALRILAGIFT
ncbi:hypothetical protein EU545_01020 [Candidatus Thorarchaeota archaeon]|nr:MAG: hypothetical protein EU545_01020 [Candidatus Thorarchaeota archaeon]